MFVRVYSDPALLVFIVDKVEKTCIFRLKTDVWLLLNLSRLRGCICLCRCGFAFMHVCVKVPKCLQCVCRGRGGFAGVCVHMRILNVYAGVCSLGCLEERVPLVECMYKRRKGRERRKRGRRRITVSMIRLQVNHVINNSQKPLTLIALA